MKIGKPRPRFGFVAQEAARARDLRRSARKRQLFVVLTSTGLEIGQDQKQLGLVAETLASAGQVESVVEELLGLSVLGLLDQDAGLASQGHDGGSEVGMRSSRAQGAIEVADGLLVAAEDE